MLNDGSIVQKPISSKFRAVDAKSTMTIENQAFSVLKCVRLARMAKKSYEMLCKMFAAIPERNKDEPESIFEKKFMGYVRGTLVILKARSKRINSNRL